MTPQDREKVLIKIKPVVMQGAPCACQVWLVKGVQSFQVGPAWETQEEGQWYAEQLIKAIAQALHAERVTVWEEAAKVACPMCAKGYPLQKNGGWHNDMNNKDTLMNNLCRGADCRDQAHKEQP